jgi:hypothetical protein
MSLNNLSFKKITFSRGVVNLVKKNKNLVLLKLAKCNTSIIASFQILWMSQGAHDILTFVIKISGTN